MLGQGIFLVPGAKLCAPPNVPEDGCHTMLVSCHLHCRPGKVVGQPRVLRLEPCGPSDRHSSAHVATRSTSVASQPSSPSAAGKSSSSATPPSAAGKSSSDVSSSTWTSHPSMSLSSSSGSEGASPASVG